MEKASTRTIGNPVLLSLKGKTKGRRMLRKVVSTLFLQDLSALGVKASVKHECLTHLKSIGKNKALTATLSDIEPKEDSNNKDD